MRSDELKPRSAPLAAWAPVSSAPSPAAEPAPPVLEETVLPSLSPEEDDEETAAQPIAAPVSEEDGFAFSDFEPSVSLEEDSLSDILSSLLEENPPSAPQTPSRPKTSGKHDAIPTHLMPVPVCVPLFEDPPAPVRKRKGWIWILLLGALLAAAAGAAWRFGLLPGILA